jgi:hypothetical protein
MIHFANIDLIFLFFILGAFAAWIKSDFEIPDAASKFLSIFLLLSLGLKGGHEVRSAESLDGFFLTLSIGLASCLVVPAVLFNLVRRKLGVANASALAASYGSVSAVTFVAASGLLHNKAIASSGYMVAVMALMEIPSILVAVYLYQRHSGQSATTGLGVFQSILSAKSVVLLLGGFAIGLAMNDSSWSGIAPVVRDSFKGVLAFFLLDLGMSAQKKLAEAWKFKGTALFVAIALPAFFGTVTLLIAHWVKVPQGDQVLLAVLAGSASYIAAPAAIRSSIPEANPSLYLALPLALTFPMNLGLGIPLYIQLSHWLNA